MARKLVVMFDGTWNNRKSRTNVVRMREAIASSGPDDPSQPCFYDPGVGTHWYDKITGGAFGRGLFDRRENDELFVARLHLDADPAEVPLGVALEHLKLLGRHVARVRIELGDHPFDRAVDQLRPVHRVHVLVFHLDEHAPDPGVLELGLHEQPVELPRAVVAVDDHREPQRPVCFVVDERGRGGVVQREHHRDIAQVRELVLTAQVDLISAQDKYGLGPERGAGGGCTALSATQCCLRSDARDLW